MTGWKRAFYVVVYNVFFQMQGRLAQRRSGEFVLNGSSVESRCYNLGRISEFGL